MTRVAIEVDEYYPFHEVGSKTGDDIPDWAHKHAALVEVDEETLARWAEVRRAFEAVQDEMQALYDANPPSGWGS